jgi:aerobic-type carbon monoxide dehydrogenase small subunit (CoxS/CutS family)
VEREIKFAVNGQSHSVTTDPDRPLLDVLREELGLTGTKYGCGEGECGACTVLVGDIATRSCITTVAEMEGVSIETIEGLAADGTLHTVQQAFLDQQALQCGYCVPGQILSAVALLRESPDASEEQIRDQMDGNICRCCNYANIFKAVLQAAGRSVSR